MKKISEIKKKYAAFLNLGEIDILLAEALEKNTAFVAAHPEYKIRFFEWRKARKFFKLLKKNWPIAYIIGHKEFFGLDFLVNRHTLIPRPETELLVENVLAVIARSAEGATKQSPTIQCHPEQSEGSHVILIDIGTGTGCIPISIVTLSFPRRRESSHGVIPAKAGILIDEQDSCFRRNDSMDPRLHGDDMTIYATDISRRALRVAKKNAKKHGVKINFLRGNLLEPIIKSYKLRVSSYKTLIITANLPYLTPEQFAAEPSIQHEPKTALVGGADGLELYEKLLRQIKSLFSEIDLHCHSREGGNPRSPHCHSREGGNPVATIFFEIDPTQSKKITNLIQKYLPSAKIEIKKDLAGLDRLIIFSYLST